jgi:hypothetical protein
VGANPYRKDFAMAEWGPTLDWAAVVLPTFLAIVGVFVSIEAPRLDTRRSRWIWRSSLIVFGIVVSVVTYAQQYVTRLNNEREFGLRYVPYLVATYQSRRFEFYNNGKSTLFFWGYKIADSPKSMMAEPRLIPVGAFYYIPGDQFEAEARRVIGSNGEARVPLEVYLKNELGEKYINRNELFVRVRDGAVEVHVQMVEIDKRDW